MRKVFIVIIRVNDYDNFNYHIDVMSVNGYGFLLDRQPVTENKVYSVLSGYFSWLASHSALSKETFSRPLSGLGIKGRRRCRVSKRFILVFERKKLGRKVERHRVKIALEVETLVVALVRLALAGKFVPKPAVRTVSIHIVSYQDTLFLSHYFLSYLV